MVAPLKAEVQAALGEVQAEAAIELSPHMLLNSKAEHIRYLAEASTKNSITNSLTQHLSYIQVKCLLELYTH